MASAKQKVSLPRRILHHKFYLILIIILLGVAGYFGYEKYAAWQNKRDFQQARAAIDSIYADIVRQVGPPDNSKRSNDCSRSYQEFTGYGNLTCDLNLELLYAVSDRNDATVHYKKIQTILGETSTLSTASKLSTDIIDKLVVSSYYHEAQDSYMLKSLKCTSKYVYDTPQDTYLSIEGLKNYLFIVIGCSGNAISQYYPLAY